MLPWRRSKFVLVEEERKGKGKSLGPGLSYASLLASFLRSCPDLLPECPLERLGSVFRSRRQKVELTQEEPSYTVWYLGNAVTLHAKGEGCTDEAVGKIWAKSGGGGGAKMKLSLGPHGIRMTPCDKGARRPGHAYLLHRITYCVADGRHPKVFAWVYRHQVKNKAVVLRCHAVLVSKADKARAMALLLYQTSVSAFNEFKRLKRQNDFRHVQQQLLGDAIIPLVPIRKLLNAKCPYRPPAERNRSAPRLSSILEEEEDESLAAGGDDGSASAGSPAAPRPTTSRALGASSLNCSSHRSLDRVSSSVATAKRRNSGASGPGSGSLAPGSETAKQKERATVLTLTREMRGCSLRSPLPHGY
ncbi:protein FAM43B [Alligator sinensis]|uniref:Protein FAM43B n=1 Tax=Alligator sinensis TaxID=38654 RepID=A0A1U7STL5_ALLSI|nr:protein FAM43B [Alligator sinensis]